MNSTVYLKHPTTFLLAFILFDFNIYFFEHGIYRVAEKSEIECLSFQLVTKKHLKTCIDFELYVSYGNKIKYFSSTL